MPGGIPITVTVEPPAVSEPMMPTGEAPLTSTVTVTPTLFLTPTEGVSATVALNGLLTNVVSFDEGQVALVIEEETVAGDAELQFTAVSIPVYPVTYTHTLSNPAETRYLMQFQLDMMQGGVMVNEFDKPVRIVVDLRGLTEGLDPTYAGNFFLAYQDEADPTLWHDVPITVHQEDGLISAEVTHFSTWVSGTRPTYWKPSFTPPTVSSFSGAATFSQEIDTPHGRNSLQPNVALSYSSRALDGLIHDTDAGEVAHGWSLTNISISRRELEIKDTDYNSTTAPHLVHPDKFSLVLNGTSYEIYPASGANTTTDAIVRYYAKDGPGLFIQRYYDATLPTDGIYWIVITADDTLFRLGYTADSEKWQQAQSAYREISGHQGDVNDRSAVAWYVDTVTDAFGNQMQYTYFNHTHSENVYWINGSGSQQSWTLSTQRVRIDTIKYNYPDRVSALPPTNTTGRLTTTPATRIEFRKAMGTGDLNTDPIENIYIYHNSTAPIKEYRIVSHMDEVQAQGCINEDPDPDVPRPTSTHVVDSIQQFANTDSNPLTNDGWGLPATTFSYISKAHHYKNNLPCFSFRYLSQVNNGYGGSTSFSYTGDGRTIGAYQYITYGQYNWPEFGRNYFVTQVTSDDGRNNDLITTYSYTGPCYDQTSTNVGGMTGAMQCYSSVNSPEYGNIVGFAQTTQTNYDYDGTTPLNRTITTFGQNVGLNLGRPTQIDVGRMSGSTFVLLGRTDNTYSTSPFGPTLNFIYTSETKSYQYKDGDTNTYLSTKTQYAYDTTYQGNAQYGNLTHIYEYDDAADATPYRTTRRWYYPNTSGNYWHVNKVGAEALYQGNGWTQEAATWTYYDNNSNWTTSPTQGMVKKVRRVLDDSTFDCLDIPGGGGSGCTYAYQTADTTFGYDVYGNQTSITTYRNYRYQTFTSSWAFLLEGDLGSERLSKPTSPMKQATTSIPSPFRTRPLLSPASRCMASTGWR